MKCVCEVGRGVRSSGYFGQKWNFMNADYLEIFVKIYAFHTTHMPCTFSHVCYENSVTTSSRWFWIRFSFDFAVFICNLCNLLRFAISVRMFHHSLGSIRCWEPVYAQLDSFLQETAVFDHVAIVLPEYLQVRISKLLNGMACHVL